MMQTEDNLVALSIADAIELPGFSPKVRNLVNRVADTGGDISLTEVAAILGEDPQSFALRIVGEMVMSEVTRLSVPTGSVN